MDIKEKSESFYKIFESDTEEFKSIQRSLQIAYQHGANYVIDEIEARVKDLYDKHPGTGDMRTVLSCVLVKLEMLKHH
jgi:hypothetical protein